MTAHRQAQSQNRSHARLVNSVRLHVASGKTRRNWERFFLVELVVLLVLLFPLAWEVAYSHLSNAQANDADVLTSVSPGGDYTLEVTTQGAAVGGRVPIRVALYQGDIDEQKSTWRDFVVRRNSLSQRDMQVQWANQYVSVFLPSDDGQSFIIRLVFDDCWFTGPSPFF